MNNLNIQKLEKEIKGMKACEFSQKAMVLKLEIRFELSAKKAKEILFCYEFNNGKIVLN